MFGSFTEPFIYILVQSMHYKLNITKHAKLTVCIFVNVILKQLHSVDRF